jgi:hypothetical protein
MMTLITDLLRKKLLSFQQVGKDVRIMRELCQKLIFIICNLKQQRNSLTPVIIG